MTKIIISLLLITPVFAGAAPAQTDAKTNVYRTITDDLLKDCTGVNKTIAVAGFSYSDGHDSRDGGVVAERITTELVKLKKFKVIERKELEKVYAELKFQQSGLVSIDTAKQIGKTLGADWIIVGTLTELPDKELELNARLVGVESGEIINAGNTRLKKDWLDQYRKLLEEQNKAIEKNSKDAKAFYERGRTNIDLGKHDEAIADFSIAIAINPAYCEAYSDIGWTYYLNGKSDKALENLGKAIEIDPKSARVYRLRGGVYVYTEQYDKAIEDFIRTLEINPKDEKAYAGWGYAYLKTEDYGKAIEKYSKAIEINPKYAQAYNGRGDAYHSKSEDDKAIEDYSKAIELDPEYAEAYNNRGIAYRAKGEYEKAATDEEKYQSLLQK